MLQGLPPWQGPLGQQSRADVLCPCNEGVRVSRSDVGFPQPSRFSDDQHAATSRTCLNLLQDLRWVRVLCERDVCFDDSLLCSDARWYWRPRAVMRWRSRRARETLVVSIRHTVKRFADGGSCRL